MDDIISYGRLHCQELSPHKNRGMEITYVEEGLLEWMVEDSSEHIEAGSVYFTLPWQVHGSMNPKEPKNTICHILFRLKENYLDPQTTFCFPRSLGFNEEEMRILSRTFCASPRHGFPATPVMRNLMPDLIRELQSTHELRTPHATSLLRAILVELKRIVAGESLHEDHHTYSEKKVRNLIADLSATCDQKWTLANMATHCGIHRTQLSNLFQKLTGSTPMNYLFRIRMERAKTLLRETDIKIIDIALECGYSTSQYFANAFKQAIGITPSNYRNRFGNLSAAESRNWKNLQFRSEEEEQRRVNDFLLRKNP